MPRTEIDRLSDEAAIWIFGITPRVDDEAAATVLRQVDAFLDQWAAHRVPVLSGRDLRDGSFLIVAAEKNSETSGCSIDAMFGIMRALERAFGVQMLDASRVFYRDPNGDVASVARGEFRNVANEETIVFDTTAQRLGDVRSGAWERRAADSWHAALLRRSAQRAACHPERAERVEGPTDYVRLVHRFVPAARNDTILFAICIFFATLRDLHVTNT